MDNQKGILSWAYFCQGKTMEALRHSLVYATLELKQTRLAVLEVVGKKEDQLLHLKYLLTKAIKEKEQTQEKFQRLLHEKILIQQQQLQHEQKLQQQQQQQAPPLFGVSSIDDEPKRGMDSRNGFSSSGCEESIVSSPVFDLIPQTHLTQPPPPSSPETNTIALMPEKPLPEKGKLLQAVMKAGPLLENLLLAGPLPQWRHPPPQLESSEIPPVAILSPPHPRPCPQLLHQDSNQH